MKLPKKKYWYHGTSYDCVKKIMQTGLKGHYDATYFVNRRDYAASFGRMRYLDADHIAVLKIPAQRLSNLEISYDHNPSFFPKDLVSVVNYSNQPITVKEKDVCGVWSYKQREA